MNQKRLDAEAKQLHVSATNFAKQTHQWMNLIEGFSSALKVSNRKIPLYRSKEGVNGRIASRKLAMLRTGLEVSKVT